MNNSNCNNDKRWNELFKLVWGNIVLVRLIFVHVRLFKKNELVKIKSRKELIEYEEREYIQELIYQGDEMLYIGDLSIGGELKQISFSKKVLSLIKGDAIPYGVEIINFGWTKDNKIATTPFSTLPSSVHTVINAIVKLNKEEDEHRDLYNIPSNITTITFCECPNISGYGDDYIIIPNTINTLEFPYEWNNQGYQIAKNDIPEGITSLTMYGYDINNLEKEGTLPNSIKQLKISNKDKCDLSTIIPRQVESLEIDTKCNITLESNLNEISINIKKLTIDFIGPRIKIQVNSLPPSLTDLSIYNIMYTIEPNTIPHGVKTLKLYYNDNEQIEIIKNSIPQTVTSLTINRIITQPNILPTSLTHLVYFYIFNQENVQKINKMISILPKSLSSITLPKSFKRFKLSFPNTINKIDYN